MRHTVAQFIVAARTAAVAVVTRQRMVRSAKCHHIGPNLVQVQPAGIVEHIHRIAASRAHVDFQPQDIPRIAQTGLGGFQAEKFQVEKAAFGTKGFQGSFAHFAQFGADFRCNIVPHRLFAMGNLHDAVRRNMAGGIDRLGISIGHAVKGHDLTIHKFFQERDFVYVHTPLITGSDCEGAGEMFQVTTLDLDNLPCTEDGQIDYSKDFFGKETNLTVSGQLNGETFAQAFRNIYTFGPTFRAENSNTTRHAAEFWMIEPEIAFADLSDDMKLAEDMIKFIIAYVLDHAPEEMAFFNQFVDKGLIDRLQHVMTSDFGHVTYTEAVKLLEEHNDKFDYKVFWGCDLQTEHERYLTEQIFKRPVFVTDYPKEIKAFYMKLNPDGKTVAAMDCLVPGIGEIIGGSQREDNYDTLLQRMHECGLKEKDYQFYLDLRKYGSTRHAGFGLGFERCVMYLTGISNIRDVLPFPRTVGNCEL